MESVLLGIVGAVLSLVFSYFPAVRVWLDSFDNKGLVMLGVVAVVSVGYFALSCSPFALDLNIVIACDKNGALQLLKSFYAIAVGNQLAFLYTRPSK